MLNSNLKIIVILLILIVSFVISFHSYNTNRKPLMSKFIISNRKNPNVSNKDKDFKKAEKYLRKQQHRKERIQDSKLKKKKNNNNNNMYEEVFNNNNNIKPQNFAKQTITGQNIIEVRKFNVDGKRDFEFLGGYNSLREAPKYPLAEIAFLGRSNVGKSSLLNTITGQNKKIAVESKTPGRTQMINLFKCSDKGGDICIFVDLPGYGFAKMSKSKQDNIAGFLKDYIQKRGALRQAVLLVDARREPQDYDLGMADLLDDEGIDFVVVATKADKLKPNELERNLQILRNKFELQDDQPIPFSSVTGKGKKSLWRFIQAGLVGVEEEEQEGEDKGEKEEVGNYYEDEDYDLVDEFYDEE